LFELVGGSGHRLIRRQRLGRSRAERHDPQVLRSDHETRLIAIRLPGREELQGHQVHERALLLVADGEIEISQDGTA
jgi:hypothetical protein